MIGSAAAGCLAALLLLAGGARAAAEPARPDPAARLLPFEEASDVWDLAIRTDQGHWIVAQATIGNLGPGDRTAAVVGHVIDPEGGTHEFHKVRREGDWQLSEDRRRLDLDSILFEQADAETRLYVGKKRVDLDLRIDLSGEAVGSEGLEPDDSGFDLLALAAPVSGTLRLRGQEPRPVRGSAFLTHRWMPVPEGERVARRLEWFAHGDGVGVYFVERTAPDGSARRWLVAGRDGRIWHSLEAVEASYADQPGGGTLSLEAPGVSGRVTLDGVLLRDEPLRRTPWLVRWWYRRVLWPRFVWSAAPFEIRLRDPEGGAVLRISGEGLVDVARFDPSDAGAVKGWGER